MIMQKAVASSASVQHLHDTCAPVSVVIVCYNQAQYLAEAIESVAAQSDPPMEVILVDDGSTDNTAAVARDYSYVDYVWQTNRGLAAARNTGLRVASSEYVLFLDADDLLRPNAIRASVECFERHPDVGFVFGAFQNIFSDRSIAPTDPPSTIDHDHYLHLLEGNFIGMHGTVLYRRSILSAAGGFRETLPACEDYELYLRIARRWPVGRHSEVVAEYRQHDTNMSRDYAFMLRSAIAVLRGEGEWIHDRRHRRAQRAGIRAWREYYGELLMEKWYGDRSLRGLAQLARLNPRGVARWAGSALLKRTRSMQTTLAINFGSLRRLDPVSRHFGFDRGQPVDRYYVERFLTANQSAIGGRVLEVGDDTYSRRYAGDRIMRQDVLHVEPGHPGVTIVADLANAQQIPSSSFDCIILTQTLHYIFDTSAAIATIHRILKPGGVALVTLPGISKICRDQADRESDCWRFTATSARRAFTKIFGSANVQVATFGNVLAATAFLQGLAAHELSSGELDHNDPDYQVVITVSARKARETR